MNESIRYIDNLGENFLNSRNSRSAEILRPHLKNKEPRKAIAE